MKQLSRHRIVMPALLAAAAFALSGCLEVGPGGIEGKIGHGPFSIYKIEAGPHGIEEKGPSAGHIKVGH